MITFFTTIVSKKTSQDANLSNLETNGPKQHKTTSRFHSYQPRTQIWGCSGHRLTKSRTTAEERKNSVWSDKSGFLPRLQMVGSEFGVTGMNLWSQPALSQQSNRWWFNGVGNVFLVHFGPWNSNQSGFFATIIEYCCCPCKSLHGHSLTIF